LGKIGYSPIFNIVLQQFSNIENCNFRGVMRYYQVCVTYKFVSGKPSLSSLSLHSTPEYFPFLVGSPTSLLSHSRFFHTQKEANIYINYLFSRYPNSGLKPPVLDALQLLLF
jgi:hypothetical protein